MTNNLRTGFKVILNSSDTWTGARFNATYNLDLKQILRNDSFFDKQYKMTFNFRSSIDVNLTPSKIYLINFAFSNGTTQQAIYQTTTKLPATSLLKVENDSSLMYTLNGEYNITGTTITTNQITLNATNGLVAGQSFVISGTSFGGLVPGTYSILSVVSGTNITLANSPTLSTATGVMTGITTYNKQSSYLIANEDDNAPTYISNLRGLNSVTLQIMDSINTNTFYGSAVNYVCVLHFEEII